MLIRIPDEYKALLDYLNRQGIPYTVEDDNFKKPLEDRAETLHFLHAIDLNRVDFDKLINGALQYTGYVTQTNPYALDHIFSEAIQVSYGQLIGQPYEAPSANK